VIFFSAHAGIANIKRANIQSSFFIAAFLNMSFRRTQAALSGWIASA